MVTGGTNCLHSDNYGLRIRIIGTTCRLNELVVGSYVKGLVGNALLFVCPDSCKGFSFRALARNCTVSKSFC